MATVKIFKLSNTNSYNYYIGASVIDGSILRIYTDAEYRYNKGIELKIGNKLFNFLYSGELIGSFYIEILREYELQNINSLEDLVDDEINDQIDLNDIDDLILNEKIADTDRYEFQVLL